MSSFKVLAVKKLVSLCFRALAAHSVGHGKKTNSPKCCRPSLHTESISFMKGVMDECTHMANFSGRLFLLECTASLLSGVWEMTLCMIKIMKDFRGQ